MSLAFSHRVNVSATGAGSLPKRTYNLRHYEPGSIEMVAMWKHNPFAGLVPNQRIAFIPRFTLECGQELRNAPVAYTTHGKLSRSGDNVVVVCHALSGSADVNEWWAPLLGGPGCPLDTSSLFVVCLNSLGSPYGSASPMTYRNGQVKSGKYGPFFPPTTVRDDVNIHQLVLADLGVRQIAAVIGGSMGGMLALEYAFLGKSYVRSIIAIATAAEHSAWCIGWSEIQRQSIRSDPKFKHGQYSADDPPLTGLAAARKAAMLTYRSRDSIQRKFDRKIVTPGTAQQADSSIRQITNADSSRPTSNTKFRARKARTNIHLNRQQRPIPQLQTQRRPLKEGPCLKSRFAVETYLDYQGTKFVRRFDSNCYIALTQKLDTHDISRGRASDTDPRPPIEQALAQIEQPVLVIGIESDMLFPVSEQMRLAKGIRNAHFRRIASSEGHDAFLLSIEQVAQHIVDFMQCTSPTLMAPKIEIE